MASRIDFLKQIMRFGIVGTTAAMVNLSIVIFIVQCGWLQPLYANVIAFFIAFQVSYFGHRYWTFSKTIAAHKSAIPKLLLVSGSNFIANEGLFYFFLNVMKIPYPLALLIVLATLPVVTFTLGKLWIFREAVE
jgi:putative flippase GtrA